MGIVYEARDERLGRLVALKFLSDELAANPDAARRLRREAQTLARLNHPNICTIHDVDEADGRIFIVMERLEGMTLKAHIAKKTLDTAELLAVALRTAGALQAAHEANVVHRDIKSANVFITGSGELKVLDFGMARQFRPDAGGEDPVASTMPGRPVGTVSYMAPERILQLPLDARCDLFSLGVVIYEMATGRLPFTGASPSETVTNILENEPVPLTKLSPSHPLPLERVVNRLLAKQPDDRYQTAKELTLELTGLQRRHDRTGWRRFLGPLLR